MRKVLNDSNLDAKTEGFFEIISDESRRNILFAFLSIAVIFTLPVLILFYFMFQFKTDNISFAQKEINGLIYQTPLQSLSVDVMHHKLLTFKGDLSNPYNIARRFPELKAQIKNNLSKIILTDQQIASTLEFTHEGLSIRNRSEFTADNLQRKWAILSGSESSLGTKAILQEYDGLLRHIRIMTTHLGDTSKLILDPDLDSYYLMDVTLLVIPQLQDRINSISKILLEREDGTPISAPERAAIGSLLSLLSESDMGRLKDSTNSAIREDANFYGKSKSLGVQLPIAVEELKQNIGGLESYLRDLSTRRIDSINRDQAQIVLTKAIKGTGNFWNIAAKELKILLENRIAWQTSDRRRAILYTSMAWLLSIATVIFVCGTVLRKQKSLADKVEKQGVTIASSSKMSALGEMAGNIAHEINTPIAAIKLTSEQAAEILGDEKPDMAMVKQMLQVITQTSDKVGAIILGMRKFSRNADTDPFIQEKVSVLIADTLILCQESFRAHNTNLRLNSIDNNLSLECRAVEISQVLLNLLNNSLDAIEQLPERWIHLSAQDCGNEVEISVTDSGKGIMPEVLNKLFTPFFTTKPIGKGTGLGLGISRKIIEDHRGTMIIDRASANTRFVIRLPKYHTKNYQERESA